jgi:hypothetical protein
MTSRKGRHKPVPSSIMDGWFWNREGSLPERNRSGKDQRKIQQQIWQTTSLLS